VIAGWYISYEPVKNRWRTNLYRRGYLLDSGSPNL
jgi:hypothetical protein